MPKPISATDALALDEFLRLLSDPQTYEQIMTALDDQPDGSPEKSWLFDRALRDFRATQGTSELDRAFNNAPSLRVVAAFAREVSVIPKKFIPSRELMDRCREGYFLRQRRRISREAKQRRDGKLGHLVISVQLEP